MIGDYAGSWEAMDLLTKRDHLRFVHLATLTSVQHADHSALQDWHDTDHRDGLPIDIRHTHKR